jgi:hypothetical protein
LFRLYTFILSFIGDASGSNLYYAGNLMVNLGVDGRIILNGSSRNSMEGGVDCIHQVQEGQVAGSCECGNEPSGFIHSGEFLD